MQAGRSRRRHLQRIRLKHAVETLSKMIRMKKTPADGSFFVYRQDFLFFLPALRQTAAARSAAHDEA